MQVEHDIRIISLDENFDAELEKLKNDGWRPAPGFAPFAIYPVVRDQSTMPKPGEQLAGFGGVMGGSIDDSKVFILKAGEKPQS